MRTVLLIEDNLEMRENTAEILELSDHKVLTAENGKRGIELAKRHADDLDIILCDIMMPEMDGYGVLHILSKLKETSTIPFIFISAKAEKQDFRKGMSLGADDYIIKPFTEMELLDAIERRINRTANNDGAADQSSFRDLEKGKKKLLKLLEVGREMNYKKKETIFHEGDQPNYLYWLKSGKVKLYKVNEEGKEFISNLYGENTFFSISPLVQYSAYDSSAQTMEPTELTIIPKKELLELISSDSNVSAYIMQLLGADNTNFESRLLHMAYDSVRKRVARGILLFFDTYNREDKNEAIAISREDLANIVGTSTESVIRTLHDFKEEQLIEISGRSIAINNRKGLQSIRS